MPHECHQPVGKQTIREVLMDEHRVIERVLDAVERMVRKEAFDKAFLIEALDFFRNFADGCHHAKEEEQLFPELERAGLPRERGPIGCMLNEHHLGRSLIRTIAENLEAAGQGDALVRETVYCAASEYIAMLRAHIEKEDRVLFVVAEDMLATDQKQRILAEFDRAEAAGGDSGKHEQYVRLADRLSRWTFPA